MYVATACCQDGARLSASIRTQKASVADVAAEIVARNPVAAADGGLTVERLMRNVEVDPADDSHVLGDLHWGGKGILVLPESIGDLTVSGSLNLDDNKLESLPESFGSLTVGGDLDLHGNPVAASLNENSFPGFTIKLDDY